MGTETDYRTLDDRTEALAHRILALVQAEPFVLAVHAVALVAGTMATNYAEAPMDFTTADDVVDAIGQGALRFKQRSQPPAPPTSKAPRTPKPRQPSLTDQVAQLLASEPTLDSHEVIARLHLSGGKAVRGKVRGILSRLRAG